MRKSKGFFKKALVAVSILPEMLPSIAPPNTLVVSTYINREFEQGSVSSGCAMAVLCVLITTTALLVFNRLAGKQKGA